MRYLENSNIALRGKTQANAKAEYDNNPWNEADQKNYDRWINDGADLSRLSDSRYGNLR
jgi:hypothetical protein